MKRLRILCDINFFFHFQIIKSLAWIILVSLVRFWMLISQTIKLSQSVHPFSAHEEDPQPTSPLPPHQEARSQPANPSAQQGDAPKPDASSCPDTVVNEGEQYIYSGHHL